MTSFRSIAPGLVLAVVGAAAVAAPTATYAANRPRIEYVQVLNGAGHPRTAFAAGQKVEFKVVVYAPRYKAGNIRTDWRVAQGHRSLMTHSIHGFHGPTRGNLFSQMGSITLSSHASRGTYTVQAKGRFGSKQLSRTVRFYVR